jgi:hypothetical protein
MRDSLKTAYRVLIAAAFAGLCTFAPRAAMAQNWGYEGSTESGPSVDDYMEEVGPDAKFVANGELKIDGKTAICGKRPTVLNPKFDSWGGAFPGFLILNTAKIKGLGTEVKLYIYSHECGHQFVGADETQADLFAIRRGVKWGWLDAQGMDDICTFISQLKGDGVHPPGPQRCETMRNYYNQLIQQGNTAASTTQQAHTLGPAQ